MGAGKSYYGKKLADYYNLQFVDLDDEIMLQENLTITDIFVQKGEVYFRQVEHEILQQYIKNHKDFVMACGGGTPCFYNNIIEMKKEGVIVWINPSQKILFNRLQQEQQKRPLIKHLTTQKLKSFITQQIQEREKYYNQSNIIINDDNINIEELAKTIQHYA